MGDGGLIGGATRHALDRFREHFPDATHGSLMAAAQVSIPVDGALAHTLLGRPAAAAAARAEGPTEEHRLHPEGTGIFVLVPHSHLARRWMVVTYLRLHGAEQRRLARKWFLDPLEPLQRAFELGFAAARDGAAGLTSAAAVAAAREALLALGPRLAAGPVEPERPAPAPAAPREVPPVEDSGDWSETARKQREGFLRAYAQVEADFGRWAWLGEDAATAALAATGGPPVEARCAVRVEPGGLLIAVMDMMDAQAPRVLGLRTLPRAARAAALDGALPEGAAPAVVAGAAPGAAAAEGPPPDIVSADAVPVWGWSARAQAEAEAIGFVPVAPSWLHLLAPVPADTLLDVARELGWALGAGRRYAARTDGKVILLLAGRPEHPRLAVERCGRLPGA